MKNFAFGKYCTPAQLYLILGAIGIIIAFFNNFSMKTLLTNVLFLVIWAWVLNWLCSKGFKAISWIIVLLPFIFFLFTYFLIKDVAVKEGGLFSNAKIVSPKIGGSGRGICGAECEATKKKRQEEEAAKKKQQEEAAEKKRQEEAAAAADPCNKCKIITNKKTQIACEKTCK